MSTQRYVSSRLHHFVGRTLSSDDERYSLLVAILRDCWLVTPMQLRTEQAKGKDKVRRKEGAGSVAVYPARALVTHEMYQPDMVCFCDIPEQDLDHHYGKYSRFGLSFEKIYLSARGARPVTYVPVTSVPNPDRKDRTIVDEFVEFASVQHRYYAEYEQTLRRDASAMTMGANPQGPVPQQVVQSIFGSDPMAYIKKHIDRLGIEAFLSNQLLGFVKFFDPTMPDDHPENYYMEREWRVLGNVRFELSEVQTIFYPKQFKERFLSDVPAYAGSRILT